MDSLHTQYINIVNKTYYPVEEIFFYLSKLLNEEDKVYI